MDVNKLIDEADQIIPAEVRIQMQFAENLERAKDILAEYQAAEARVSDILRELEFASKHCADGIRDLIIRASEMIRDQQISIKRLQATNAGQIDLINELKKAT